MPLGSIEELFKKTHRKLNKVTRRYYSLEGFRTFILFVVSLLTLFLIYIIFELLFDLVPFIRISFWVLALFVTIFFFIRYFFPSIRPVFSPKNKDFLNISRTIGKENSEVQDSLIDFLQIYHDQSTNTYSAFKYISLKQLYNKFQNVDFQKIINFKILIEPAKRFSIL